MNLLHGECSSYYATSFPDLENFQSDAQQTMTFKRSVPSLLYATKVWYEKSDVRGIEIVRLRTNRLSPRLHQVSLFPRGKHLTRTQKNFAFWPWKRWLTKMSKKVENFEFFHVTRNLFYSTEAPLKKGDRIDIGDKHNPFYSFYEKSRSYSVNTEKGNVQVPAIKFLSAVASGEINCPNVAQVSLEVAQHYMMLSRELIMEQVRQEVDPEAPSRQSCLWITETMHEAKHWQERLGGDSKVVRFQVTGVTHRADASLLLGDSEPISETLRKARLYWRGKHTDKPEWETLFEGTASVIEIMS